MTSRPGDNQAKQAATRLPATDARLMAVLVFVAATLMILWAQLGDELIPVRDGIGYDGYVYANVVRDPGGALFDEGLDAHRLQRVVPSLLAYGFLRPLGLHTSDSAIIMCFSLLNLVLMVATAYLWFGVARRLELSRIATWVGFTALFVNYGLLKFASYYPVLTDTAGFFLGMALLWGYLHRRYAIVLGLAVVAAFTWPTVFYSGLLLYALSRPVTSPDANRRFGLYGAFFLGGAVALSSVLVQRCGTSCVNRVMLAATVEWLLPLSVVLLGGWIFLAARPLAERLGLRPLLACLSWPRLAVAVGVFVALTYLQSRLAAPGGSTLSRTLANTSLGGATRPLASVVAHTVYYGPGVMLLVLRWRRLAAGMSSYGPAFVLLMLVHVLLSIAVESRILMNMWPFFVAFAAIEVDQLRWTRMQAWAFAGLSLLVSRVWFPLNHGELVDDYREYPDQYYGMSIGPRMTVTSYLIMAGVTVVCAVTVWLLVRPRREQAAERRSAPARPSSG